MKTNNIKFIAIAVILTLSSCGIPKIAIQENTVSLPDSFNKTIKDSVRGGKVKWKGFFNDPYLSKLIDQALVNNKELAILVQKVNMANNEIQARKGEYLPNLNFGAGDDLDKVGEFTRNGAVEENLNIKEDTKFPNPLTNYKLGLYSSWELDVWKKLRNAKKVAVMEYLASQEGKNFLVTNLIAEVSQSYYELIALDSQLSNLQENIKIQKNALEVVKLLKESARTTSLAVKRFEAEVLKNESEIYSIKQDIVETENKINFLIGRFPQAVERNSNNFLNSEAKMIAVGLPSKLLENRPDIKKAELEMQAAKLNIKVARANFYPSFGLKVGVGLEAFNPKFLFNAPQSLLYSLAGDAVAPLINRNAIKAAYKNASAKQIQMVFEYEQILLIAYSEVINNLSKIDNLEFSFQNKNKQVKALDESVSISNQLFQSARADYMEVLLTQRDVLEAKMSLISTKRDQFIAMVKLYKSLGGGWN